MLLEHYGEKICFTYPRDVTKSQVFFSTKICSGDVIETLRSTDSINICAERLHAECKQFDFKLDSTLNKPNDLKLSLEHYQLNHPEAWTLFLQTLCPSEKKSKNIQRKTDNIFQIAFNLVNDGLKNTLATCCIV